MSQTPEQFWMVYRLGGGAPTFRHATREVAAKEARRLARSAPDRIFVVLEAVEAVVAQEFVTTTYRAAPKPDPLPF